MIRKITALLAAALLLAGCGERTVQKHTGLGVIAMAPNTAEILYALGLSNSVVGVSRFCSYPPDVTNKPTVGGLYDPNWEMIVALQPDLVIGLTTQKEIEGQLKALGINFLGVSHEHIGDILQSILTIGKACGAEAEAEELVQTLEKQTADFSNGRARSPSEPRTSRRDVPAVLVCVGHDESLSRMYVAAQGTFYDELIELAGGTNACTEATGNYPEISPEGLAAINPDIVIDILPMAGNHSSNHWKNYRSMTITNDYAWIPGPRFVLLLEDFAKAIHE
jgi:iron complex transport system substrate-binding protein